MPSQDATEQEKRLTATGVLLPLRKTQPASAFWPEPPGYVSDDVMEQVGREEREDR